MRRIKISKIVRMALLIIVTVFLLGSATHSGAQTKTFKWRAVTFIPRGAAATYMLDWAADQIKKRSNGRLDITWFYAGEIMPATEMFNNLKNGTIEMAHYSGGYLSGVMPEADIEGGLPGVFREPYDTYSFLYGPKWNLIDKLKTAYSEHGVMYLHVHKVALQQDLMFKKPITRLSDLKGMKIRTYGLMAKWVTAAGAGTVWFPGSEIYTSLAAGTVDGVSWAGPAEFWDLRAHEVAKYYLPGALLLVGDNDLINMKAWNSLPDDLKLIVELVMAETSTLSTQETFLQDELAMKKMIKEWGVKRVVLPPEDVAKWREMAIPIWDEVAKANARSAEWINLTKDWMKWRGYLK